MIALIDYGVGNIRNVYRALKECGLDVQVTSDAAEVNQSRAIVLPGVGAYRDAMENLRRTELIPVLEENLKKGKMLMGICLGMQLLFESSSEGGFYEGLSWIPGKIVRFETDLKVPHMGWNPLTVHRPDPIVSGLGPDPCVYFVHSYYLTDYAPDTLVASAEYGIAVPAVVRQDNIIGIQFHPEKSGRVGMQMLNNFKEMIR